MADRFYRDILEALAAREVNYDRFEECACDLLRDVFPGIVPIRGGADAGMDGAIPTASGHPMPVVVTTAENVIGNLSRNLDRYLAEGGQQRIVVLATSCELTPRKRRNLEARAEEMGFLLAQVFERRDLARRLYHRPEWCRDLLGLSGRPAALSEVPPTRRPLLPVELIGRDEALGQLRACEDDCVLVGEPGAGKTFLLNRLVGEGSALFLASSDETAIANDLRRSEPNRVIIDDAHGRLDQIDLLRHLRSEHEGEFSIVATTWPWRRHEADVAEALGVPESRIQRLGLLTRDEIVEVVKQAGLHGPDGLIKAIVDQSGNKPGLVVTLALLCLQGEGESVVRAASLSRNILSVFQQQVGPESVSVLACLAVGGEKGMPYQHVAEYLRLSFAEIRETVTALAAAGVLKLQREGVLSVEPLALRAALIRDEVLAGPAPLDHRRLVDVAEDSSAAVDALVAGVAYGATMNREELRGLVRAKGSRDAWQTLAALNRDHAEWARKNYPGSVMDIAAPALHSCPDLAVGWLLEEAERSERTEDEVLEILGSWVSDARQPQDVAVERRRILVDQAVAQAERGRPSRIFWRSIRAGLSLRLEATRRDPGAGRTFTWSVGRLVGGSVEEVAELWERAREVAVTVDCPSWQELQSVLRPWLDPEFSVPHVPVTEEERGGMLALSRRVLEDLAPRFVGQPGVASEILALGASLDLDLGLSVDPEFELLYPDAAQYFEAPDEERKAMLKAAQQLASTWSSHTPSEAATRLATYDEQAHEANRLSPRLAADFARRLSGLVDRPEEWLEALAEAEARADLLVPFIDRLLGEGEKGGEKLARDLLEKEQYSRMVAERILVREPASTALLDSALGVADQNPDLVEPLCRQEGGDAEILRRLLTSSNPNAARAAVVGLWHSSPRGEIRSELRDAWRATVVTLPSSEIGHGELVSSGDHEYWLGQLLGSDPDLAFQWLGRRLEDLEVPVFLSDSGVFKDAIASLGREQRRKLLAMTVADRCPRGFVALLVDRDQELYRELLARQDLEFFHLVPLQGQPEDRWWDMAKLAVTSGNRPVDVAEAALYSSWVIITAGSGIDRWQRFEEAFGRGRDSSDPVIREVAEAGIELVQERLRSAEAGARRRAVEGYH